MNIPTEIESIDQTIEIINVNRLNIVLIGPAESGKTSLIKQFKSNEILKRENLTTKITINENVTTINNIPVSMIDNNGFESNYNIQDLSYNTKSLYILMYNPTKFVTCDGYSAAIISYYNHIKSYFKNSPIIFVATYSKELQSPILYIEDFVANNKIDTNDIISIDLVADHNNPEYGLCKVVEKLKQITSNDKYDFFKYQVPNYYLDLEREIKLLRNTKKIITFDEFKEYCEKKLPLEIIKHMTNDDYEKILKTFCSWYVICWFKQIDQIHLNPQELFDTLELIISDQFHTYVSNNMFEGFKHEEFEKIFQNYDIKLIPKFIKFLIYKKIIYVNINNRIIIPYMNEECIQFNSTTFCENKEIVIREIICNVYKILQNINFANSGCFVIKFNRIPNFFSMFSTTFADCIIDSTHYTNSFVIEKKYYDQINKKFIQSYCCVIERKKNKEILFVNFDKSTESTKSNYAIDYAIKNFVKFASEFFSNLNFEYYCLFDERNVNTKELTHVIESQTYFIHDGKNMIDISLYFENIKLLNAFNKSNINNLIDMANAENENLIPTFFEQDEITIINNASDLLDTNKFDLNYFDQNNLFPNVPEITLNEHVNICDTNNKSIANEINRLAKYYNEMIKHIDLIPNLIKLYYKYCLEIKNHDQSVLYVLCKTKRENHIDFKYCLANIYFDQTTLKMSMKIINDCNIDVVNPSFAQTINEAKSIDAKIVSNLLNKLLTKIYKIDEFDEFDEFQNIEFVNEFHGNIKINLDNIEGKSFGYESIKNIIELKIELLKNNSESIKKMIKYDDICQSNEIFQIYLNKIKSYLIINSMKKSLTNIKIEFENDEMYMNFNKIAQSIENEIAELIENEKCIEYTDDLNDLKQTELKELVVNSQQNISDNCIKLIDDDLKIIRSICKHVETFKSTEEIYLETIDKIKNLLNCDINDNEDKFHSITQISEKSQQIISKKIDQIKNYNQTLKYIKELKVLNVKIKIIKLLNDVINFNNQFVESYGFTITLLL